MSADEKADEVDELREDDVKASDRLDDRVTEADGLNDDVDEDESEG